MTNLTVYSETDPTEIIEVTEDADRIAAVLASIGVGFERWRAAFELPANADETAVLETYRGDIDRLIATGGYQSKDVVRVMPDHPERNALRASFLAEHTHEDDEVRFFVEGAGTFYVHGDSKVIELYAERGDLINVPAGAKHWFDTGEKPFFTAIRLFTSPNGWEARFTGDPIAERFVDAAH